MRQKALYRFGFAIRSGSATIRLEIGGIDSRVFVERIPIFRKLKPFVWILGTLRVAAAHICGVAAISVFRSLHHSELPT